MRNKDILKIKDRRRFIKELQISKKQNFDNNMKFVRLYAEWLKRTSNKEWSRQQKKMIDEVYRANRHLRLTQQSSK